MITTDREPITMVKNNRFKNRQMLKVFFGSAMGANSSNKV